VLLLTVHCAVMPLHLLGKKSWNVYNSASIERVRRDEADARAKEEAEEQRMQEEDAARRTAILRGESVPAIAATTSSVPAAPWNTSERRSRHAEAKLAVDAAPPRERERKRRRLNGEDDTDRDIRFAREDAAAGDTARRTLHQRSANADAKIVDHAGHIQLIPAPDEKAIRKAEKNAEVEAEKAKKRKREEDQYTMRFSNAAGFNNHASSRPWYASNESAIPNAGTESTALVLSDVQVKDVWGNEDPLRKGREHSRLSANDPFAMMQKAQRQLKQSERDRERWEKERRAEPKRRERERQHERRRRDEDEVSLEDFSLDGPAEGVRGLKNDDRHKGHRRRHRRHRSRSRSRDRDGRSKHRSSKERT